MPALNQRHKEIQFLGLNLYCLLTGLGAVIMGILMASVPILEVRFFLAVVFVVTLVVALVSLRFNGRLYVVGFVLVSRFRDALCWVSWQGKPGRDRNAL